MITKYAIDDIATDSKPEIVCADCARDFVSLNTGVARSYALAGNESVEFTSAGMTFVVSPSDDNKRAKCGFCGEKLNATLTISIGRNIPAENVADILMSERVSIQLNTSRDSWELQTSDWLDFQQSVESIFRNGKAETRAIGESVWDGQEEDTAVFQWFNSPKPTEEQLAELREIANKYGQESIAVTWATPTFI
jgi:hypothetical protein